jgi:multidrug resistance efflux pump
MLSKYLEAAIGVVDAVWLRWPVNGYVASLLVQLGDYATVGKNLISWSMRAEPVPQPIGKK